MSEFRWRPPRGKRDRLRGYRRIPRTACPSCDAEDGLVVYRKEMVDWGHRNVFDWILPTRSIPTKYALRWRCNQCSFMDMYAIREDPMKMEGSITYNGRGKREEQSTIDQWSDDR